MAGREIRTRVIMVPVASEKPGFNKPGALARYFAERWLEEPSAKDEQLIARLLEGALGRNTMYFIEKTKEYVDAWPRPDLPERRRIWPILPWKNNPSNANHPRWRGSWEIIPENAFDGFVISGDQVEDIIIPYAVFVWTCMNGKPWPEEVYHRWLEELLAAGSDKAAYLAASLWPADGLMKKATYRPAEWLVYRGQLDAMAERVILTEMLRGKDRLRTSLDGQSPERLPEEYIKRHGFTHPICGLVEPRACLLDGDLRNRIQEALATPSWSEGMKDAAMLLYVSLNEFKKSLKEPDIDTKPGFPIYGDAERLQEFQELSTNAQELLKTLEQKSLKFGKRHINIINFCTCKIENIDYDLIKDYIKYFLILYNKAVYNKFEIYINEEKERLVNKKVKTYSYLDDDEIRKAVINFSDCFKRDFEKIKSTSYSKRSEMHGCKMFLDSNHIGLYLYYDILQKWVPEHLMDEINAPGASRRLSDPLLFHKLFKWPTKVIDFRDYINTKKEYDIFKATRKRIIKNYYENKLNKEKSQSLHLGL